MTTFATLTPEQTEAAFAHALAVRAGPAMQLTPQDGACLLLARRLARTSLTHFIRYVRPDYLFAPHHRQIIAALETMERGECRRLVVSSPPRSGKSLLTSILAPAWLLGRHPAWEIVVATYGQDLSNTFGRQARNVLRSPEYRDVFPTLELDESAQSIDQMKMMAGGGLLFTSKGSALTGRGFDFAVADDTIRDAVEASSSLIKQALLDWWRSVFLTRQAPGARIVVTATRWALDDLTGTIIEETINGGEQWMHLHFRAIDEHGAPLWPERFPLDEVLRIKQAVGPSVWRCLYQNDPVEDTGNFFNATWLQRTFLPMDIPKHARLVCASDFALSAGRGDYSVHVIAAVVPNAVGEGDDYFVIDVWRRQAPIEESVSALCSLMQRHRGVDVFIAESDTIILSSGPYIADRMRASGLHPRIVRLSRVGNKESKAGPLQGALEAGRVHFLQGASWLTDLTAEMLQFPNGLHDDIVDALANVIRGVVGGRVRPRRDNIIELSERQRLSYDPRRPFGGQVALGAPDDTSMLANNINHERI